jgi:replicative DNA helicase
MIAYLNALEGTRVHVFTPEVTAEQFFSMLLPLASNIPFYKVRRPKMLNPAELQEVLAATDRILQLPMTIDDTSGIEIGELVAKAKMHISRGAQLVIVDYLQLVNARNAKTERERVNAVSGGLRDLAKQTRVPVIALSQLSRPGERNVNERPTLYHLKESGNLEQDAYSVLLLYRPQNDQGFTGDDEVIVGKQRFGDTATVNVKFNKARVTFEARA